MSTHPRSLVTLAADLRSRDDAGLAALLAARPDLLSPVPSDVTSLAARATTRPSAQRALERLDRFQLQVLEVLRALPEPVTPDQVTAALGGVDATAALETLRERALAFGDGSGGLLVPRAVADLLTDLVGPPAGLGPPLAEALARYGPRRREQLAADIGGPPHEVLADPERLDALLAQASPEARAALDALTWGPAAGRVSNALREVSAETAQTPVDWLLAHGLFVAVDAQTVVIPREVALRLRGGLVHREVFPAVPPAAGTPADPERVRRGAAGAAADAVRLVEDLLELWAATPPRVLRAGGVGVRDRSRTAASLDVTEETLALLAETAYAAGLVAPGEVDGDGCAGDEVWLPTPAYDSWLDLPTADRWLALATGWRDSPRVAGLAGQTDSKGRTLTPLGPDLHRSVAPLVRREVLADLAELPPDVETTTGALLARQRWRHPLRGGRLVEDLVAWTVREAGALGLAAGGALAPHGRAVAAGEDAAAVDALAEALPPLLDHVLLQGDLTAIAPGPLQPDLARRLRLLADVESTGGATVYRFSEASVRRAFDAGWSAAEVSELLAGVSRTPVPQALSYLVDDIARRHGQVRVGAASAYVRCDDEATVQELLSDKRSGLLRLRRIAPTVLAAQSPPDVVLDRLRDMGFAPVVEGEGGAVLVAAQLARRTPARRPPAPTVVSPPSPAPTLLSAAVAAIRAGDRAQEVGERVVSRPTADVLAILTEAAADAAPLWIGYVDAEGRGTQRVIEPVEVDGGYVTAFDHLRQAMRSFAIHRITAVSPVVVDVEETGA